MRRSFACALAALGLAASWTGPARAAMDTERFKIRSAQDLVDLCAANDPQDSLYDDAINFCHGFVSGAYQYYLAEENGPKGVRLVCPPDPPPTRTDAIAMFVDWAHGHAQYMNEPAVDTLFRFLTEKWPCPEPPAKTMKKKGGSK